MQTLYYNVHAVEQNRVVRHIPNGSMNKKMKDFCKFNPAMRAFLRGLDTSDDRNFINSLQTIEFEKGERIIRKDTWDRCILILAGGRLTSFDDTLEGFKFDEGAILGVE